jgi:hypothetical protein
MICLLIFFTRRLRRVRVALPENHPRQQDRPNIRSYQVLPDNHVAAGNHSITDIPAMHAAAL